MAWNDITTLCIHGEPKGECRECILDELRWLLGRLGMSGAPTKEQSEAWDKFVQTIYDEKRKKTL